MALAWEALRARGHDTGTALRILRQLVMARLVQLDCEDHAPLEVVTRAVTELGEFALDQACQQARRDLDERHGAPLGADGQPVPLWIIGMGKFGARELNVSSDIDLIYVYAEDGETAGNAEGRNRISNHEYFGRAVKAIYSLIGDTTEHGFVFRVDLALRPNGNSGPTAISLDALEEYFLVQGREWERFAWLKSRVVAPARELQVQSALALRALVMPFVFRRYLDYAVFESLRKDGADLPLTTGEFAMLKALVRHPRQPLSRDKLAMLARGREFEPFDRSLDVQVSRLRKLLEEDPAQPRFIQTVWGVGYVFVPDENA